MISGMVFHAGRARQPSALLRLVPGRAITVSTESVLMLEVCPDTDAFTFHYACIDGRRFQYRITPRESLDLTAMIGYSIIPRAVCFSRAGSVDRVVCEFVKLADFAPDLPGVSHAQQR